MNGSAAPRPVWCATTSRPEWSAVLAKARSCSTMRTVVYGQINVYGVTTKSERCERSYRTRSAAGNGIGGREAPVPYGS